MSGDVDLEAFVRSLREQPQRLEELRRLLFPSEPDLRSALTGLAAAQERTETRLEALTERVEALTERVEALVAAQERTEARLEALADQMSTLAIHVSTLTSHVERLLGDTVERQYREKGHAYLSSIARRLRTVPPDELEDILDEAVETGTLTAEETQQIRLLDAVFRGRREGRACYLVIEASVGVGVRDVTRARERADLLTRTGTPTVAVVAGDWVDPEAAEASRAMGVWQVTNGGAVAPAD